MTVQMQKKINSVLQQSSTISKPDTPNDKAIQTGRHRPGNSRELMDFCQFCTKRHASISCPTFNPVDGVPPAFMTHNPEDLPVLTKTRAPSRCLNCKVTSVEKWVEDGVEVTLKRKMLCPGHLTMTSSTSAAPPTPAAPTSPPPPTLPTPAPPTAGPSHAPMSIPSASSSALDLLLDPAVYDGSIPDDGDLVEAIAQFDSQPAAATNKFPKTKKTRTRNKSLQQLEELYTKLMELCCTGMTLSEACAEVGISRSKFYTQRSIVELSVVDRHEYELVVTANEKTTITQLNKICKERLEESSRSDNMASLRQIGLLLP